MNTHEALRIEALFQCRYRVVDTIDPTVCDCIGELIFSIKVSHTDQIYETDAVSRA